MKLSKLLLNAILISITAGAVTSCEKEKEEKTEKTSKEKPDKKSNPGDCPGCGMG